jgi:hypothetical protein
MIRMVTVAPSDDMPRTNISGDKLVFRLLLDIALLASGLIKATIVNSSQEARRTRRQHPMSRRSGQSGLVVLLPPSESR